MRKQSGFTLIELLITLVVAGILASMAIPSFKTVIYNDRLVTQANDLLAALSYARSEAAELNGYVTVCASTDQATCSNNANGWGSGWIICQEPAANTAPFSCLNITSANILRVQGAFSGNNRLSNNVNASTLTFASSGTIVGTATPLSFDVCDSRGNSYGRSVYVYASGQARASPTVGKRVDKTSVSLC